MWNASSTIFRGWARSRQSNALAGIEETRKGLHAIRAAHMEMRRPYYLALLAEGNMLAGRNREAKTIIDEACSIINETGEHWSEPELYRLAGEILAREDEAAAAANIERALNIARRQGAKSWELRAAVSLARIWRGQGRISEARDLLTSVYEWFTEGFATKDLKEARTLLGELN